MRLFSIIVLISLCFGFKAFSEEEIDYQTYLPLPSDCTGNCTQQQAPWNYNNDILVTSTQYFDKDGKPCKLHIKFAWRICDGVLYLHHQELYCLPTDLECWTKMRSSKEIIDLVYTEAIKYLDAIGTLNNLPGNPKIVKGFVLATGCIGYCCYYDPKEGVVRAFQSSCTSKDLPCCAVIYNVSSTGGSLKIEKDYSQGYPAFEQDNCLRTLPCEDKIYYNLRRIYLYPSSFDCYPVCPQSEPDGN